MGRYQSIMRRATAAVSLLASAGIAWSADRSWINPLGGNFSDDLNWSAPTTPAAGDAAIFSLASPSPYGVALTGPVVNQQLRVPNDNVILDLALSTYSLTSTSATSESIRIGESAGQVGRLSIGGGTLTGVNAALAVGTSSIGIGTVLLGAQWQNSGSITIGENGAGTVTVFGSLTAAQGRIGRQASGSGTLIVDGPTASVTVQSPGFLVGSFGAGTIIVRNGAALLDQGSFLSAAGGPGSGVIEGADSQWSSADGLYVGYAGPGTLTISSGGRFTQTGSGFSTAAGVLAGSTGTITMVTGAMMDLGAQLSVGVDGSGTLRASGGSSIVSKKSTSDTHGFVGEGTLGNGYAQLSGVGTTWSGDGALAVGYIGTGVLALRTGGIASMQQGHIGRFTTAAGTVSVIGDGAAYNSTGGIFIGGAGTTPGGTGRISVGHGGEVNAGGVVRTFSNGQVFWEENGVFTAGSVDLRGGTFHMSAAGPIKVLRINSLAINLGLNGNLDLADNAIIVDHTGTSPLVGIRGLILAGRSAGAWNGPGVRSSTAAADPGDLAVGYAEASTVFDSFPAVFAGESVDSTTFLARLTKLGDADLNGSVNIDDFGRLAANFNQTAVWAQGDFNFDGETNIDDFGLLAGNFNEVYAGASARPAAAPVPEPAGLSLLVAFCPVRRRRRPGRHGGRNSR